MFTSSLWGQELWRNGSTNSKKTREIKNKADISPLVDVCIRLINIQGEILSKTLYTKFTLVYSVSRRRKWTSLKNEILPSELSDARLTFVTGSLYEMQMIITFEELVNVNELYCPVRSPVLQNCVGAVQNRISRSSAPGDHAMEINDRVIFG